MFAIFSAKRSGAGGRLVASFIGDFGLGDPFVLESSMAAAAYVQHIYVVSG